ncbi:MAG TPA: heparinase II/III family protein [Thermoguttaceae bacterium]|nr:heparinase II/III family protein [Thermoguttaceae bacterium]
MRPVLILLSMIGPMLASGGTCAEIIWWEAEDVVDTNFREHSWLEMGGTARDGLSGGDWLTLMHKVDQTPPEEGRYFARYRVRVPESSKYHLWAREWPRTLALANRWRFDQQTWRDAGKEVPFEDSTVLASNRAAGWSRYGVVDLAAGEHTFELEVEPRNGNATFDCFLLYRGKLQPSGKQKPPTDADLFQPYAGNRRVEVIVRKAREAAHAKRRLAEEIAASKVGEVDFTQVGRQVDVVRFGEDYLDEFRAHEGEAKLGKEGMEPGHVSTGRNQVIEWSFAAPRAGEYVLTIGVNIARIEQERVGELSVELEGAWKAYGTLARSGQYHCMVSLPQGNTRFRIAKTRGGPFYVAGARLSAPRGDPWENFRPGEHPRLQFSRVEVEAANDKISGKANHPVRYYYDGLLAAADRQIASPSPLKIPRGSAQALNEVAVAYALTGEKAYGDRGVDYLSRLSERDFGRDPTSVLGNGEYLDCMAWGYDALCQHLTDQQRKAVRRRLDLEAQWIWVAARTPCRDTIHGWWASDHGNNWQAVAAAGLGMAALALMGEDSHAESWLEEAVAQVKMLMDGGFDANGAYFESPMYHKYAMEYLTTFASALLRADGENLFEYRDQLLRKSCLYNLYMMEPTRDHFAPFNDGRRLAGRPPEALHPAGACFARIAAIHNDGLIRWLFENMYGPGRGFPVWNYQHGHPDSVVWYDDDVPTEDPDTSARLALTGHWPEDGRVSLRTGWNDPNGVLLAMECGEYGSHGHADQGGFVLTAYGEHLVDDTGYGGWEAESESHSVVLIDGKGQRSSGMLGAVRDFLHTNAMDYFEADSTVAYAPAEFVKRHVVFMRPGYFIVADEVRKDDAPHEYQWLLHSQVVPPTTEIQVRDSGGATFKAPKASLEVRLFSPEDRQMEPVEKNGHRFLRVTPRIRRREVRFLALLYPTSRQHTLPRVSPIRTDDLVGCDVGDDTVVWATSPGEWQHGPMKTDARLAAFRRTPRAVFVKSARTLEAETFALTADQAVTAILTEAEARLTVSQPTAVEFGDGYLAGGIVYETDQDRDPTNDRRIAAVDGNGRMSVPAGAFTIRQSAAP